MRRLQWRALHTVFFFDIKPWEFTKVIIHDNCKAVQISAIADMEIAKMQYVILTALVKKKYQRGGVRELFFYRMHNM